MKHTCAVKVFMGIGFLREEGGAGNVIAWVLLMWTEVMEAFFFFFFFFFERK